MKANRHRINFINGLADTKIYGEYCKEHNVWYNGNCPECEHDQKIKVVQKEIMEKGLFGHSRKDTKEQIENADQIKSSLKEKYKTYNKHRSEITRKKMKDEEYREKRNQRVRESTQRRIARRLSHSI